MRLTQEEEEERYREYEDLIDEIADLCGIDDRTSRDRIAYWKLRRRYILAVKYRCICRIISSCRQMRQLHWHGQISIFRLLKDSVWICLENTWVIKYVYPVYRDSMDRFANTIRRLFCDLF